MPAPTVRADYAELQRVSERFRQEAENLGRMNRSLKERMEILQGGDWVGHGAEKFFAEMAGEVLPTLGRLQAAVDEADKVTRQIVRVMGGTELEAAGIFQAGLDYMKVVNAEARHDKQAIQDMLARAEQGQDELMRDTQAIIAQMQQLQNEGSAAAEEVADQVEQAQDELTDAAEEVIDQAEEVVEEVAETVEDILEAKSDTQDQIIKNLFG